MKIFYFLIFIFSFALAGCTNWFPEREPAPGAGSMDSMVVRGPLQTPASSSLKQVALLLPLTGERGCMGRAVRDGFLATYNSMPELTRPQNINVIDSTVHWGGGLDAGYAEAIDKNVDFIVGPLSKDYVQNIADDEEGLLPIPILALDYLKPPQKKLQQKLQRFAAGVDGVVYCDVCRSSNYHNHYPDTYWRLAEFGLSNKQYASLYALGVDAYYVMVQLNQVSMAPQKNQLAGNDDILNLDSHHCIRRLDCKQFCPRLPPLFKCA